MKTKDIILKYLKSRYDSKLEIKDFEDKNQCFDIITNSNSINITIEYKTRYFYIGKNDKFLLENDILVEIIQSTPYIKNTDLKKLDTQKLNVAIGWFYKCSADRLIYVRTLDNIFYDLIDIDFKIFKQWLLNNMHKYKLQYSDKTTGTINLILPYNSIPKPLYNYEKKDTK